MAEKPYTIANDLKRAAAQLADDARTYKNSNFNKRWGWPDPKHEAEYNDLRRLAKRMRELSRAFQGAERSEELS